MLGTYLCPMYSETLDISENEIIETHGLMARIKPMDGNIYITGSEEEADEDSYLLEEGETLDFAGEISVCADGNEAVEVKLLYFDAI